MASKVDIGQCVSYGIDSLKKQLGFQVLSGIIIGIGISFSFGVLYGPLFVGYYRAMAKMDAGQTPEIGDLFSGFDQFLPSFLVWFLVSILTAIGFLFCIVPGLLLFPLLPVCLCVVARGEKDAIAAIKVGWNAFSSNLVMAVLALIVQIGRAHV